MSQKEKVIGYEKVAGTEALSSADRTLAEAARHAASRAYAPYSSFFVGAAALMDNGEILTASNQESEVFPSGMCAERILLYQIQANHAQRQIVSLAVAARQNGSFSDREVCPCGACAQVLLDTERRQQSPIRIIMTGERSSTILPEAKRLLPFAFELHQD